MLSYFPSFSFVLPFLSLTGSAVYNTSLTPRKHGHPTNTIPGQELNPFFYVSSDCNFSEVTVRHWRKMLARGSAGWFDIWLLGSDVVVNKTQAEYNPQSTTNIIQKIVYL